MDKVIFSWVFVFSQGGGLCPCRELSLLAGRFSLSRGVSVLGLSVQGGMVLSPQGGGPWRDFCWGSLFREGKTDRDLRTSMTVVSTHPTGMNSCYFLPFTVGPVWALQRDVSCITASFQEAYEGKRAWSFYTCQNGWCMTLTCVPTYPLDLDADVFYISLLAMIVSMIRMYKTHNVRGQRWI